MKNRNLCAMIASLAALTALAVSDPAVQAAPLAAVAPAATAPIFPIGSHIGLVPPPGMTVSKTFPGFIDASNHAVILIGTLPPGAYADLEKTLSAETMKKQGITLEKHEDIQLSFAEGTLIVGTVTGPDKKRYRKWMLIAPTSELTAFVNVQAPADDPTYSDAVVRRALKTISVRSNVPQSELLSLLPFKVGDLAGFRIANVLPGRALLLIDAPSYPHMMATQGLPEYELNGRVMIAAVVNGAGGDGNRADLARLAFNTIGGLKDIQLTMSEPVRIEDQEGFETVAHAKDAATGADLMVVQWLRFGSSAFLQIVGISRAQIWDKELSRLRALRDSVHFK